MSQITFFPVLEKSPVITISENQATTTSLNIAEVFEKRHSDVLESVRALSAEIPQELWERNFSLSNYESKSGKNTVKKNPMYTLTQDGFTLLVMGYTGKNAMQFKIMYIQEFNRMRELMNKPLELPPLTLSTVAERKPLTELIATWGKLNINRHALCRKELNNHFQIKEIKFLPTSWLPDAIAFVQGKIDSLPKAIEQKKELCLEEFRIKDSLNNPYYKMLEKVYHDMKTIQKYISLHKKQPKLIPLSKELNSLHISAEDSVSMAIHAISIAQLALHNAIKIRADFEFVKY